MTWLHIPSEVSPSAPGPAASSLGSDLPWAGDTELSATSSGKPTLRRSSWSGWATRPWIRLLSGTISDLSTAALGVARWISSLRASPVLPTPTPASDVARATRAISGPTIREVLPVALDAVGLTEHAQHCRDSRDLAAANVATAAAATYTSTAAAAAAAAANANANAEVLQSACRIWIECVPNP